MANRLGKGLDVLFKENLKYDDEPQKNEQIIEIELTQLKENPYQPRRNFDEEKIDELAQSIKEHGVFQPIIVKKSQIGFYIVAGERRYRACKKLGLETIPAIVRDIDEQTMAELALLENLQRENLSLIEEAFAYKMLIDKYSFTQQEVANRVGKSRTHVTNTLRLLNLPKEVQYLLSENKIEFGHAKILAGIDDDQEIIYLADKVFKEDLTVRALEQFIKKPKESPIKQEKIVQEKSKDIQMEFLQNELITKLGTSVKILSKEKGGKLIIDFNNATDLNRLLDIMNLID